MNKAYIVSTNGLLDLKDLYLRPQEEQNEVRRQIQDQINDDYESEEERLRRENDFLKAFIKLCGFDVLIIENAFFATEKYRNEHFLDLNSNDPDVQERAIEEYINYVADTLAPLTKESHFIEDKKDYELQLKDCFADATWNKLSKETKNALVTAKFVFDSLSLGRFDKLEYSSVCMLLSKAVEIEVSKRMCVQYEQHLKAKRIPIPDWPAALLDGYQKPINKRDFTLGSAIRIAGLKNSSDESAEPNLAVSYYRDYNNFSEYFKMRYYARSNGIELKNKILQDGVFIETVRIHYRNPAAHTEIMEKQVAEKCIRYILTEDKAFDVFMKQSF